MKKVASYVIFLLVIGFLCSAHVNQHEGFEASESFVLPEGNIAQGREAFKTLRCNTCHHVHLDSEMPKPVSEITGPVLGYQQYSYAPGWIIESIISPSHNISPMTAGIADDGPLSRMGDFSETMTVRQLIDITAYLQSLEEREEL